MKTLNFTKMGMDISDKDYTGDIGNHRVRAEFENDNGVRFFVEVMSCGLKRRISKITGKPLKKIIDVSSVNGMHIEILTFYQAPIKGCTGKWFMHEEQKTIFEVTMDDVNGEKNPHKFNRILQMIWRYTGEEFNSAELTDR